MRPTSLREEKGKGQREPREHVSAVQRRIVEECERRLAGPVHVHLSRCQVDDPHQPAPRLEIVRSLPKEFSLRIIGRTNLDREIGGNLTVSPRERATGQPVGSYERHVRSSHAVGVVADLRFEELGVSEDDPQLVVEAVEEETQFGCVGHGLRPQEHQA